MCNEIKLYEQIVNGQARGAPGSIAIIHTKYGRLSVDLEIERKIQKNQRFDFWTVFVTVLEYDSLDSSFYGSIDTNHRENERTADTTSIFRYYYSYLARRYGSICLSVTDFALH